jgi:hypothetical protein
MTNHNTQQQGPADCWDLVARVPDEADVAISGRLDGGVFKLELENPASVHMTFTTGGSCRQRAGTQTATLPFFTPLVATPNFMRPQVAAKDGATNSWDLQFAGIQITGTIEVHKATK